MKHLSALLIATSIVGLTAGTAFAACPDTSASIGSETTAGISKDGTHAPLETDAETGTSAAADTDAAGADADATASVDSDPVAKDGQSMPLAEEEGGGNKDLATSQQDVEAQQDGEQTAAAEADDNADAEAADADAGADVMASAEACEE